MDGSYSVSASSVSAKRSHSHYDREAPEMNGRQKRHQPSHVSRDPPPPVRPAQDETIFRILCPGSKTGSVIGKGGNIIKALRQETGARIKIADAVPGVDERVIIISAPERDRAHGRDRERGRDREGREKERTSRERDGGRERERDRDVRDRDDESREREILSPAQEALFRVHGRIVDAELPNQVSDEDEEGSGSVTTRLLVPNNQIGCLLGKGGKIIEQMREETGAQIRILPKEQLPGCAVPSDELVQIFGDISVVKKALHAISTRLRENPPRDRPQGNMGVYPPGGPFLSAGDTFLPPIDPRNLGGPLLGMGPSLSGGGPPFNNIGLPVLSDVGGMNRPPMSDEELVFRILCPNEKIGSVIGKGGSIIKNLREETGARIKVADAVPGSEERVIIVSANEHPDDNISPAQEAVLHIQSRVVDLGPDQDGVITTRLLVPSNQIGCLLGKGGSIIADMRRNTRANIRILAKDSLPHCALEHDELVQIVGDIRVARDALIEITTRLRRNLYREKPGGGAFPSAMSGLGLQGSTPSGYGGRHEASSPGSIYSSAPGLGLQGGGRSSSGYQNMSSSSGAWGSQGGSSGGYGGGSSHHSGSGRYGGGLRLSAKYDRRGAYS
ncbi:hypothetical protein CY35_13G080500 [Sphagnum magellanicum]|nr:hypothetical protein CY35_13G080500 [Sphagnum magellanicum]KAH9543741.1 hypothetical protein CY35_13G080500 [Sphagnum magellanicum]